MIHNILTNINTHYGAALLFKYLIKYRVQVVGVLETLVTHTKRFEDTQSYYYSIIFLYNLFL